MRSILLSIILFIFCVTQVNAEAREITIGNFGKVDNCYYRGEQPKDDEFKQLASLGIKTVINLRPVPDKNISGMNYYNIPMSPSVPPTDEQINLFFEILNNPDNLPVFVHCNQGKDRTGIMTALYRIKYYHWTRDQAYEEMKSYGYHRLLFPELKKFLFEEKIPETSLLK